ncbi:hypothetical protein [Aureimonas pseudogalii]|uniref:Uncharacterized protein n=1 Tax=Aureimonas pseudogalii TaxID=1744844 RepID=A0A7W6H957_9HYPH|nr:hypothetical protein [Aureimonas pseudogalii]MBB4000893.1 hypothetical protein [Aureimonas pseudogalii]
MGTYVATLLLGGVVAVLSMMWLTSLGLAFSQGAGMLLTAMATLYSAELFRFLERRIGRFPRP